jgi:hypothetical protein
MTDVKPGLMTTPNTTELIAIYQHIKANPAQWNQRVYAHRTECGTACCVAGWAVVRAGEALYWETSGTSNWADRLDRRDEDGFRLSIEWRARELLGLPSQDAWRLFCIDNDLADIRRVITEITGTDPEGVTR